MPDLSHRKTHVPDEEQFQIPDLEHHPIRFVVQDHRADRAGPHFDIRILPEGYPHAISFATRYGLPDSASKHRLLIQQPHHTPEYADFQGRIPKGQYGAGSVKKHWEGSGYMSASGGRASLTLTKGETPGRFELIPTQGRSYLAIRRPDLEMVHAERGPYIEKVPESHWDDPDYVSETKVDGSHYLAHLTPHGISFTSIRKSVSGGLIPRHDQVPHLRDLKVPKEFQGMVVRGELHLPGKPFSVHSGVLNSLPPKAVATQKSVGRLHFSPFEVVRLPGGKDVGHMPYTERRALLETLAQGLGSPYVRPPEVRGDKRQHYLEVLKSGGEGVVLKRKNGTVHDPVYKAKGFIEKDLKIIGFVPGFGKYLGKAVGAILVGDSRGRPVAYVGSGLSDEDRVAMHERPKEFLGRLAKVRAMEETGKSLRAPRFVGWTTDKNEADSLEKAAGHWLRPGEFAQMAREYLP